MHLDQQAHYPKTISNPNEFQGYTWDIKKGGMKSIKKIIHKV